MKNLIRLIFLGALFLSALASAAKAPFKSNEEINFVSRTESPMLALNKISEFSGVIDRLKISSGVGREVDFYEFNELSALKSDPTLCSVVADHIFGHENEITLKKISTKIIPSASAVSICSLVMRDPDPKAMIKERHLLVKVLHAKVTAFVFRFAKGPQPNELDDAYRFVEGLR